MTATLEAIVVTAPRRQRKEPRPYAAIVNDWHTAEVANWAKGDLAREVQKDYGKNTLGQFAEDVGTPLSTVQELRHVAQCFPQKSRRLEVPWSVHQAFAAQPDRAELVAGWTGTLAEARELVKSRKQPEGTEPEGPITPPARSRSAEGMVTVTVDRNSPIYSLYRLSQPDLQGSVTLADDEVRDLFGKLHEALTEVQHEIVREIFFDAAQDS